MPDKDRFGPWSDSFTIREDAGMKRIMGVAIMAACVSGFPIIGQGQNHDFPILNSLGRYFGAGYTLGGYHSVADGRLHPSAVNPVGFAYSVCPSQYPSAPQPSLQPVVIHSRPAGNAPVNSAGNGACNCSLLPLPAAIHVAPLPAPPAVHRDGPLPAPALTPSTVLPGRAGDRNSKYLESLPALPDIQPPADDTQSSPSDRVPDHAADDLQLQWPTVNQSLPSLDFYRPSLQVRPLESTHAVPSRERTEPKTRVQVNRYQQAADRLDKEIR